MLLGANCRVRLLERSSSMTVGTGPSALKLAESSPMTSKPVKPRAKSPTLVRKTERRSTTPTATTPKSSSAGVTSSEAPSLCKFAFPQDTAAKHHKPAYCSQGCASEDGHVKPYGSLGGRGKRGGRSVFGFFRLSHGSPGRGLGPRSGRRSQSCSAPCSGSRTPAS